MTLRLNASMTLRLNVLKALLVVGSNTRNAQWMVLKVQRYHPPFLAIGASTLS